MRNHDDIPYTALLPFCTKQTTPVQPPVCSYDRSETSESFVDRAIQVEFMTGGCVGQADHRHSSAEI